jgi:hypothetical protein
MLFYSVKNKITAPVLFAYQSKILTKKQFIKAETETVIVLIIKYLQKISQDYKALI